MEQNQGNRPQGQQRERRGFGDNQRTRGGAPRGGPRRRGPPRRGDRSQQAWTPVTKLGRLVQSGKITSLKEIYLHAIPIKESEIIDHLIQGKLQNEILKVKPVQKQTRAGQRTRFRAIVVIGDQNGHVGLGCKVSKEVAKAIKSAMIDAKLRMVPVKFGYWGNKIGKPHTVPCKLTGKCGSVSVRLIPAPRGTGLVAAPVPKKLLEMAGIEDCFTCSNGHTATVLNFAEATCQALRKTYDFLTPDMWPDSALRMSPFQHFSNELKKTHSQISTSYPV
ncbi:small ribosomal subunit protein uS5-like [Pempheris klunzingeri]|uniref:small ribosomal subunit protein uS5-like n=1 Tax=Pempheris klunzingeri TaxID=3127111 RepID=UPI003980A7FA